MKRYFLIAFACVQICWAEKSLNVLWVAESEGEGAEIAGSWEKVLGERGVEVKVSDSVRDLEGVDVVVLTAANADEGEGGAVLEEFVGRGGGVVAVHEGVMAEDEEFFQAALGGSWVRGETRRSTGEMALYFTDRENEITDSVSNFDIDDEIFYDMKISSEARILAAAYTPKPKEGEGEEGKPINIYDIQPQMWMYEGGGHRAFVCVPGKDLATLSHFSMEVILLRGIAWAGGREVGELLGEDKGEELADGLRYPVGGPTRPEDAGAKIELHPEFDLNLVAAEPLINKALNLDWDEKGRLWVLESPEYPNGLRKANTEVWKEMGSVRPGDYEREPLDRVSILFDDDGDGRMDRKQVFADKLELATSFVFHEKGIIVSAAPDIWFFEDTDGDDVSDRRTKLYTGLGTRDTHAVINNLRWGLDGWIYATHGYSAGEVDALGDESDGRVKIGSGVVRFKPDGSEIEMYSSKGGNTWGLCMTSDGQCFWTQPTSGTVLFHTVLPEYILAKGKVSGTSGFQGMITGQSTFPLMTWEQAAYKQIDFVGSYTAASGCAIYEGGAWPERWNYSYFTGEPTINLVSHYFVERDGVSYQAMREEGREETEFMRSKDLWFRPVETRVGPDGALYVIDFYNQAVIHNDTRGPKHGPANAAVRPDRDHYFGRIWRVQHKEAREIAVPEIEKDIVGSLQSAIQSENAHTRMTAIRLIREMGEKEAFENGSGPMRIYEELRGVGGEVLVGKFLEAEDDWSRSAVIAAADGRELEVIEIALRDERVGELVELVENLLRGMELQKAAKSLLMDLAGAGEEAAEVKRVLLKAIRDEAELQIDFDAELGGAFRKLLQDEETSIEVLPLVVSQDKEGLLREDVGHEFARLQGVLASDDAQVEMRLRAGDALVGLADETGIETVYELISREGVDLDFKRNLVSVLGDNGQAVGLAQNFGVLGEDLRGAAFDEIVKDPMAALGLLDEIESGPVDPKTIGPANVARLVEHPDERVHARAEELSEVLNPGARELEKVLAAFLPEMRKKGNVENGRNIFAGACAICHKYDGHPSAEVGPALTGMGSHEVEELLVHIVDPNREVDPTYWQWNIELNEGKTLAGIITSENSSMISLRNQGGEVEIAKKDIRNRVNTNRSLMPEGFEGLGAENLRDIIQYMAETDSVKEKALEDLPADSTEGTGQSFEVRGDEEVLRIAIVGAGSSHHFPRDFLVADSKILGELEGVDVAATLNLEEALMLLGEADVLVFSGNHEQWGSDEFQGALNDFADAGKGIVILHAATWTHPWEGYNERFVRGETKSHGRGDVKARGEGEDVHPLLEGVAERFVIQDESYHFRFFDGEEQTVLLRNEPDGKTEESHAALWVVKDDYTRIVAYTHGHDDVSHANPNYQRILKNAVRWVAGRTGDE